MPRQYGAPRIKEQVLLALLDGPKFGKELGEITPRISKYVQFLRRDDGYNIEALHDEETNDYIYTLLDTPVPQWVVVVQVVAGTHTFLRTMRVGATTARHAKAKARSLAALTSVQSARCLEPLTGREQHTSTEGH